MDPATKRALRAVNRRFYDAEAASFARSRRRPWAGWSRLLPAIGELKAGVRCLDLGCGNGRFALFLQERRCAIDAYLGIDGSAELIAAAQATAPDLEWRVGDLEDAALWDTLPWPPNLVVLFGVLHHIAGADDRLALLRRSAATLAPGGLLVYTHWLLDRDPTRLEKLRLESASTGGSALEAGGSLLSWQGRGDPPRYCHFPSDTEIEELSEGLEGLSPRMRFAADGPGGGDNLYQVLQKQTVHSIQSGKKP